MRAKRLIPRSADKDPWRRFTKTFGQECVARRPSYRGSLVSTAGAVLVQIGIPSSPAVDLAAFHAFDGSFPDAGAFEGFPVEVEVRIDGLSGLIPHPAGRSHNAGSP